MVNALIGGTLIGFAVSAMLFFNGRVTGISGIIGGIFRASKTDLAWRLFFVAGLFSGGFLLQFMDRDVFLQISSAKWFDYTAAGILVGFGTLMGSGCTSGHGVCGISRLSIRSLFATFTFIIFGILSVFLFKFFRGSL